MNDIPPKHTPDDMPPAGGNLVSFYQAASHANAESFPVLKAFQDYIEAERAQARKRVVSLSIFFAVVICAVVGGFLAAGIYLLQDRAKFQDKLFEMAFTQAQRQPVEAPVPAHVTPPAPQPAPQAGIEGEAAKEISKEVMAALQAGIGKQIDGVSEISHQVHEKVSAQESELEKLRQVVGEMREQNEQLKGDVEAMRTNVPAAPPLPPAKPAVAHATPDTSPAPAPAPTPAPASAAVVAAATATPALKDPPVTPEGVKPPDAPKGMMLTSIPLETKKVGTIPWRVIIPE